MPTPLTTPASVDSTYWSSAFRARVSARGGVALHWRLPGQRGLTVSCDPSSADVGPSAHATIPPPASRSRHVVRSGRTRLFGAECVDRVDAGGTHGGAERRDEGQREKDGGGRDIAARIGRGDAVEQCRQGPADGEGGGQAEDQAIQRQAE